jgi:hypothetical protein
MTTNQNATGVVWARVEDGFHVGSRRGEFLGYIERQSDGSFIAFDMLSRAAGRFTVLTQAMNALTAQPPRPHPVR